MDSSSAVLKQEINETQQAQHDLAKWKLLVTAALGAAAFGFTGNIGDVSKTNRWLLFFIPFVCAYVDLYDYQYRLRVLVIAKFLREKGADPELKEYEKVCESVRESCQGDFNLGQWAGLGSSLIASLVGPAFYFIRNPVPVPELETIPRLAASAIWLFSLFLVLFFYWDFRRKEGKLSAWSAAAPSLPQGPGEPQAHWT
jgi:hypothetical protein